MPPIVGIKAKDKKEKKCTLFLVCWLSGTYLPHVLWVIVENWSKMIYVLVVNMSCGTLYYVSTYSVTRNAMAGNTRPNDTAWHIRVQLRSSEELLWPKSKPAKTPNVPNVRPNMPEIVVFTSSLPDGSISSTLASKTAFGYRTVAEVHHAFMLFLSASSLSC